MNSPFFNSLVRRIFFLAQQVFVNYELGVRHRLMMKSFEFTVQKGSPCFKIQMVLCLLKNRPNSICLKKVSSWIQLFNEHNLQIMKPGAGERRRKWEILNSLETELHDKILQIIPLLSNSPQNTFLNLSYPCPQTSVILIGANKPPYLFAAFKINKAMRTEAAN